MKPCRLLELPAELRNEIYEYVLHQQDGVLVTPRASELEHGPGNLMDSAFPIPMEPGHPMALTGVSKQIRSECSKLFLACNHFKFSLCLLSEPRVLFHHDSDNWNQAEAVVKWLEGLGKDQSLLKSVTIDLGALRAIVKDHRNFLLRLAAWIGDLGNACRRRRVHLTITFNLHGSKTFLPAWSIPYSSYSKNEKAVEAILTTERRLTGTGTYRFDHHLRTRHKWLAWFNAWVRICHVLSGSGRKGVRHLSYDELVNAWEEWKADTDKPKSYLK